MRSDLEPHVYIQSSSDGFLVFVSLIPPTMPLSHAVMKLRGREYRNIRVHQIVQTEYTTLVNPADEVCGYAIWGGMGEPEFLPLMNQLFQDTPGFSVTEGYACFLLNRACDQWRVDERWSDLYFEVWSNGTSTVLEIVEFSSRWAAVAYTYTLLKDDEHVRQP